MFSSHLQKLNHTFYPLWFQSSDESGESDSVSAKFMEAQLESPPRKGTKGKTSPIKSKSPKEGQFKAVRETNSGQEAEMKDSIRRSPRIADIKAVSPINSLNINPNEDAQDSTKWVNQIPVRDKDTPQKECTNKRSVVPELQNDLELSSSESEAESVASSTRSTRKSQKFAGLMAKYCQPCGKSGAVQEIVGQK